MSYQELWSLIKDEKYFDRDALRKLREFGPEFSSLGGPERQTLDARLSVELLLALWRLDDSIQELNRASTKLVGTTNRLTAVILCVTVVGVAIR